MKAIRDADTYYQQMPYGAQLALLREIALETGVQETLKWGSPVYTVNGKNVFGIMAFKTHFGLWFFNGVLLSDPARVLTAAQQSTKALRQWKFKPGEPIHRNLVLGYMKEAIANQEKGLALKPQKKPEYGIPAVLEAALKNDAELSEGFRRLTPFRQREYCEHIGTAKMEKTQYTRLKNCIPLILKGMGLHDKYR